MAERGRDEVMLLGGEGSNLQPSAPKAAVLPIELPPMGWIVDRQLYLLPPVPLPSHPAMGSLIKKRRKRMRKKKHKKMLKRTRWQRRAGK
jgi:hypothetical protein